MTIWLASGNAHKKKELADILLGEILKYSSIRARPGANAWELRIPSDAGLDFDPEETGDSFLANALIKAEALYRLLEERRPSLYTSGDPVIADDSGICVDALGGRPGIYSARYCGPDTGKAGSGAGERGINGKQLSAAERNALLLAELGDNPLRSARFVCAMVLYYGPDHFYVAQETMEGELVKDSGRGAGGFGYDPIMYIPELGRTAAELSDEEKNRLSHRGKAGRVIGRILC